MRHTSPAMVLGIMFLAVVISLLTPMLSRGRISLWSVILIGLADSIMSPTIFTWAIDGLGKLIAGGSALLIMAILVVALIALLRGYLADTLGLRLAFIAPALCYLYDPYFAMHCHGSPAKENAPMPVTAA